MDHIQQIDLNLERLWWNNFKKNATNLNYEQAKTQFKSLIEAAKGHFNQAIAQVQMEFDDEVGEFDDGQDAASKPEHEHDYPDDP